MLLAMALLVVVPMIMPALPWKAHASKAEPGIGLSLRGALSPAAMQMPMDVCTGVNFSSAAGSPFGTVARPRSVATGDFNNDGILDLAVSGFFISGVTILLGDGSGGFTQAPGSPFSTGTGTHPNFVVAGDFNNDGKLDLAMANPDTSDSVSILLGDGTGGFTPATGSPIAVPGSPVQLAIGDFNHDGKLDLVTANFLGNNLTTLLGDGAGGFTVGDTISTGLGPNFVAVGDFNNDGRDDLVYTDNTTNTANIVLATAAGGFSAVTPAPATDGGPNAVAIGDFNRDGKLDLAIANSLSNDVTVLTGNGDGTFAADATVGVGRLPKAIVIGDFNHDGIQDLATTNGEGNTVTILVGDGSGGFTQAAGSPRGVGGAPLGAVVGDFNRDGKDDIATANLASDNVTVLLNNNPAVTASPINQAVCSGGNATFTASASGAPPPTVQWQVSTGGPFTNIPGATGTTLILNTVTSAQNGNMYQAVFMNSCATAASAPATLTVNVEPAVTASPLNQAVCPGGNAIFTASASGAPTPTVQWQVSTGGPFTNIPGATSTTLTVNSVTPAQNGSMYQAVFTNSCAMVTSSPAMLTVNLAPAVTASPINQTACSGSSASFTAAASGTPAPTVQWQVSSGGAFTNIPGATSTTLTLNSVTFAQNGNKYQAVFANACNTATSSPAMLTVNTAPGVTASPLNQTICAGGSVSFTAAASGTPAPTVQWQVSSGGAFTNIPGATSTTLTLNSVTFAQNGNKYQAVFTNACNTATSSAAMLTVNTAPVVTTNPTSQMIAASSVTFTAAASGTPTPTIQWQVSTDGGTTFANIPGATASSLTFSPIPSQSGYKYRAVFTNVCATATTSAATLTFFDTCIQDNTSRNTLQLNTTTGEYRFIRCSDGFTITGKGALSSQNGIVWLTDRQSGWIIRAGFNPGQRTGTALIQIIIAPGVSQTVTINDTNPANTCACS
jgi:hypothetical protein